MCTRTKFTTLETLRTEIAWSDFKTDIPVGNKQHEAAFADNFNTRFYQLD